MAASKVRPRPRPPVKWEAIEAECGDYRDGFVAVFRRYEGRLTNEHDASNRPVRVTAASFARHMGIPEQTFRNWLNREVTPGKVGTSTDRARIKRSNDVLAELRKTTRKRTEPHEHNDNAARIREARRMLEEAMKLLSLIE